MLTPLLMGNFLRKKRKELGLTQRELALRLDEDHRRVSDWENNRRLAPVEAQEKMAALFKLDFALPVRCNLRNPGARTRPIGRVLPVQPDRPMGVRLSAAKDAWPDLVRSLERQLLKRPDHAGTSRFFIEASGGSKYEALLDLRSLAANGRAVEVAPLTAGFRVRPVVDPASGLMTGDRRVPAIELKLGELDLLLIPQVSVQVLLNGKLRALTVDFLMRINRKRWTVVEVNGPKHDPSGDGLRPELLGLPVIRMTGAEVASSACMATLRDRVAETQAA